MKKKLLLSLCVILMLSIVGCSASGRPAPTVTPSCDAYVGMPMEEFWELYKAGWADFSNTIVFMGYYYFIEDDNGNPVVITCTSTNSASTEKEVTSIVAYDKNEIELSSRSFYAIKAGMTVHEVISRLGKPKANIGATGERLSWRVDDVIYDIDFRATEDDPFDLVVVNVYIRGENAASIINHWYIPFID